MLYSDQFAQDVIVSGVVETDARSEQQPREVIHLESLVPQNVSSNKRAVIERLIALYQSNSQR